MATTTKYASLYLACAPRASELVQILVHGATGIPLIDGEKPRTYVVGVTGAEIKRPSSAGEVEFVNGTNPQKGISCLWNEMIYIRIPEEDASRETFFIMIVDDVVGSQVARFAIRLQWLDPFCQYHLNLQSQTSDKEPPLCLYVSIMRRTSALSTDKIKYFGLETLLKGFDFPLVRGQSMYAVARVVLDYNSYKNDYLANPSRSHKTGVIFQDVMIPSSQDFRRLGYKNEGFPQVSVACRPATLPLWSHIFFFTHPDEREQMFSNRNTSLVIEFYPAEHPGNSSRWKISGLLGWTAIRLDRRTHDALRSQIAINGMQTAGLTVENDGDLACEGSKKQTVQLYLRLIPERHPVKNLLILANDDLPVLPSYYIESFDKNGAPPVYEQLSDPKVSRLPRIQGTRPPAIPSPQPVRGTLC